MTSTPRGRSSATLSASRRQRRTTTPAGLSSATQRRRNAGGGRSLTREARSAVIQVEDVKAEASRLRAAGVEVGVVLELHGQVRLLDVYDGDGNRIQLTRDLDTI